MKDGHSEKWLWGGLDSFLLIYYGFLGKSTQIYTYAYFILYQFQD